MAVCSEHRAVLGLGLGCQRVARLRGAIVQDTRGDILADGGTVFEAVSGAAADQPDVCEIGMAVDQEIAVGCIFVLADARFN